MSARPYITCRELIDFIADYLDGALGEREGRDFARHLEICPSCRAYLATYQVVIRAGKQTLCYDDAVSEEVPEDLVRAILKIRDR